MHPSHALARLRELTNRKSLAATRELVAHWAPGANVSHGNRAALLEAAGAALWEEEARRLARLLDERNDELAAYEEDEHHCAECAARDARDEEVIGEAVGAVQLYERALQFRAWGDATCEEHMVSEARELARRAGALSC